MTPDLETCHFVLHSQERLLMKRFFLLLLPLLLLTSSFAQDWIKTGTGLGVEKVRLAVPDFNASTQDAEECRPAQGIQRNAVERSGQCRHLRHGFEELLSHGSSRNSGGREVRGLERAAPECGHAGLWQPGRVRERHDRAGLALRCKKCDLAASVGQAISGCRDQRRSPH